MDRLFLIFLILCIAFLAFTVGAVSLHYNLPATKLVHQSLLAFEAWQNKLIYEAELDEQSILNSTTGKTQSSVLWDEKRANNGYTLIVNQSSPYIELVDMDGKLLHHWNVDFRQIWKNPGHVSTKSSILIYPHKAHAYPNGDLLVQFAGRNQSPYGYGMAKIDKNSNVLWRYNGHAHHDFYIAHKDGTIYALTQQFIKAPHGKSKDNTQLSYPILDDYITRISPDGKEIDRFSVLEAFKNSNYYPMLFYKLPKKKWDLLHSNSIMMLEPKIAYKFPMFKAGQVLISVRNPSIIAVIDLTFKKVVWAQKGMWEEQHEAKFTDDGFITLFDNKGYQDKDGKFSRAIIFDPKSAAPVWTYSPRNGIHFYTRLFGRAQLLKNGNMLIVPSMERNVFEVTPDRDIVWSYKLLQKKENYILTATRYSYSDLPFLLDKQ